MKVNVQDAMLVTLVIQWVILQKYQILLKRIMAIWKTQDIHTVNAWIKIILNQIDLKKFWIRKKVLFGQIPIYIRSSFGIILNSKVTVRPLVRNSIDFNVSNHISCFIQYESQIWLRYIEKELKKNLKQGNTLVGNSNWVTTLVYHGVYLNVTNHERF